MAAVKRKRVTRSKTAPRVRTAGDEFLLRRRIDDLAAAHVSVLAELWILKDRQAVLEEVLARHGLVAAEEVDRFEPDGEFRARLDAERRAWTQRMVGALFRRGLPKTR
jgi:hypothetical protein